MREAISFIGFRLLRHSTVQDMSCTVGGNKAFVETNLECRSLTLGMSLFRQLTSQ